MKKTLTLLLICLLLSACGYRFSGGGQLPGGIKRIAVDVLDNRSRETGIEVILTNDIINEFIQKESIEVTDRDRAQAILTGVIRSASSEAVSHRSVNVSAESEITVTVDMKLTTPGGAVLWSSKGFSGSESYIVSDEKIRTEENKRSAVAVLSERLAQRIYYRLTDEF